MIEYLACSLGRNDEEPNISLAIKLVEARDKEGIKEIVDGLYNKNKVIANDCIKVLYEIGSREPELIADYYNDFLKGLSSKNNRLVWGSMTALSTIVDLHTKEIFEQLNSIYRAYQMGSVITIDNCMTVLAKLCMADRAYEKEILPFLFNHLTHCRAKEIPQHIERISICLNEGNFNNFMQIIDLRRIELSETQNKRIDRVIKSFQNNCYCRK